MSTIDMRDEALKLALEALATEEYRLRQTGQSQVYSGIGFAITALRTAIEAADEQEAWKTSDTAYRPEGLPQDFTKHEVNSASDWSEWVCPDPTQYFMKCCDCGLVHEMQFNVVKYSASDKCEDVDDPHVQAVFRARRATPPSAQPAPVQEPVAKDNSNYRLDPPEAEPAQRQWVGLTDDERRFVRNSVGYNQFVTAGEYAEHVQKATEAKLKERNA